MSKWISVKDKMPKEGKDVLTWDGTYHYVDCVFKSSMNQSLEWFGKFQGCVTHWMPLPKPPRIKNE